MLLPPKLRGIVRVAGLPAVEPPGCHAGQRGPQPGGGGGLHQGPGAAARLHQVPLQPGHQLHQPGGTQVIGGYKGLQTDL